MGYEDNEVFSGVQDHVDLEDNVEKHKQRCLGRKEYEKMSIISKIKHKKYHLTIHSS